MRKVRTPNTISYVVRKPKGFVNQFHTQNTTLCENQEALCENQKTLYHPFLNPWALKSPFFKHLYHCESLLFLCHLTTSSLSIRHPVPCISLRRLALQTPFKHGPKAISQFPTWHGPEKLFSPLHRVALRGKEPPLLGCLVILHLKPRRPRKFHILRVERPLVLPLLLLSAYMTWGDHLLHQGRLLYPLRF